LSMVNSSIAAIAAGENRLTRRNSDG
jgi:hypothetical protein